MEPRARERRRRARGDRRRARFLRLLGWIPEHFLGRNMTREVEDGPTSLPTSFDHDF